MLGHQTGHVHEAHQAPHGKRATAEAKQVDLVTLGVVEHNEPVELPDVLRDAVAKRTAGELVKERGLGVVRDESALEKAVDEAVAANPQAVSDYLKGKESALAAFFRPIMQATKGQADANTVRELLKRKLDAMRQGFEG